MIERVAVIAENIDAARGGAERSVRELTDALVSLGLHVDLLTARGPGTSDHVRVLCPGASGRRVGLSTFARALRRHLSQTRYDIVHSVLPFDFADLYQPRGGTYAELIRRNADSYARPTVRLCKRATAFLNFRRARLLRAERRLCQNAEGPVIAALSQYVVRQLQEHYGTDPRRIVLTLNGVRTDRRVDPEKAARWRAQIFSHLGVTPDEHPMLFLFVAQDFRRKGLEPLIRALHQAGAAATERRACLAVVGADRSTGYRRLAKRLGVEKRILFLGLVQEVQNVLAISDVGILPTFSDAASRFILEALAAGKPVITTQFNGATDHFAGGRHGIVIASPEDLQGLGAALRHFCVTANVERAAAAIRTDKLAEEISIRRVARDLVNVYNSILERKAR